MKDSTMLTVVGAMSIMTVGLLLADATLLMIVPLTIGWSIWLIWSLGP